MKAEHSPIVLRYNGEVRSTTSYSNQRQNDIYFLSLADKYRCPKAIDVS